MNIKTIGLFGFGRFGRMVSEQLPAETDLRVYDRDRRQLVGLVEASSFEQAAAAQLLILCVPISAMGQVCKRLAPHMREGQIVMDTCSVKERPVEWMLTHLPKTVQVLGTHPLFGPDSGREGIAGLKMVLCPARISRQAHRCILRHLESLRLVLIEATPAEHDRQIAQNQAIFHLIAEALKNLKWENQPISTPGPEIFYRLLKTVQQDTNQLFLDMESQNRHAAQCRRLFLEAMADLSRKLMDKG